MPLILCGHDCVDRAMTYHEDGFSFTKAFISRNNLLKEPISDNSNKDFEDLSIVTRERGSQMVKRMCGPFADSLKNKNTFPVIYGPQDIYDGVCKLEEISTHISNQEGFLTKDIRNNMDKGEFCDLLNKEDIEKIELEREPYEYYFKCFTDNKNTEELKNQLGDFRTKIGGAGVQKRSIENRRNGIEPDDKLGELNLEIFKADINILKKALHDKTSSRIRVCKDNGDIKWIIHFQMKKNEFNWNDKSYKIIEIEKNGNCLFNSFIKSKIIIGDDLDNRSMRRKVKDQLSNNKHIYDEKNLFSENDWDDKC